MKKLLAPLVCVSLLSGCVVHVGSGGIGVYETSERHLSLSVDDIRALEVQTGSGELTLIGVKGMNTIEVDAQVSTYSQDQKYTLSLEQHGRTAELVARSGSRKGFNIGFSRSARIDMTVKMPAYLMLEIANGSGNIEVSNVDGDVKIDNGSGSVEIHDLGDDLEIDSGSGNIEVSKVEGNVDLDMGSGNIDIRHIDGNVDIESGSGNVDITDINRTVRVETGSGNIDAKRIHKLEIVDQGSGNVYTEDVNIYIK
jgi:DUF4097 and DUF4098 domain-containing protein YvlB